MINILTFNILETFTIDLLKPIMVLLFNNFFTGISLFLTLALNLRVLSRITILILKAFLFMQTKAKYNIFFCSFFLCSLNLFLYSFFVYILGRYFIFFLIRCLKLFRFCLQVDYFSFLREYNNELSYTFRSIDSIYNYNYPLIKIIDFLFRHKGVLMEGVTIPVRDLCNANDIPIDILFKYYINIPKINLLTTYKCQYLFRGATAKRFLNNCRFSYITEYGHFSIKHHHRIESYRLNLLGITFKFNQEMLFMSRGNWKTRVNNSFFKVYHVYDRSRAIHEFYTVSFIQLLSQQYFCVVMKYPGLNGSCSIGRNDVTYLRHIRDNSTDLNIINYAFAHHTNQSWYNHKTVEEAQATFNKVEKILSKKIKG